MIEPIHIHQRTDGKKKRARSVRKQDVKKLRKLLQLYQFLSVLINLKINHNQHSTDTAPSHSVDAIRDQNANPQIFI